LHGGKSTGAPGNLNALKHGRYARKRGRDSTAGKTTLATCGGSTNEGTMASAAVIDREEEQEAPALTESVYARRRQTILQSLRKAQAAKSTAALAAARGGSQEQQRSAFAEVTMLEDQLEALDAAWKEQVRLNEHTAVAAKYNRWRETGTALDDVGSRADQLATNAENIACQLDDLAEQFASLRGEASRLIDGHRPTCEGTPWGLRDFNLSGRSDNEAARAAAFAAREFTKVLTGLHRSSQRALADCKPRELPDGPEETEAK
jgi:hypothetical protein